MVRPALLLAMTAFVSMACEADRMAAPHPSSRVPTLAALFMADSSSDRAALTALYLATGGPDWANDRNWVTFDPLDDWFGVTADSLDRVTRLVLPENNLAGPIPPEFGNLTRLEHLDLENNYYLTGQIPPRFGNLRDLEHLNLIGVGLEGPLPPELGNLANLKYLKLYAYLMDTPIPSELGSLVSLETLYLEGRYYGDGGLTGPIPPELGSLERLDTLYLNGKNLTGPIPPELGNLAGLEYLFINGGHAPLPGYHTLTVPPELGSLANLKWLYLDGLTGMIPLELATHLPE